MQIHPLAVVHPSAKLGRDVVIGPFSIVERGVVIGDECTLEGHVVIKQGVTLGPANHLFEGAVVGGFPQHLRMPERIGSVTIGARNTIREHVTIHRALHEHESTSIGDFNLLMAHAAVVRDVRAGHQ